MGLKKGTKHPLLVLFVSTVLLLDVPLGGCVCDVVLLVWDRSSEAFVMCCEGVYFCHTTWPVDSQENQINNYL